MKFGNLAVVLLPVVEHEIMGFVSVSNIWRYAVARMDKHFPSDDGPVEDAYKCKFVPVGPLEPCFYARPWYCCDFFNKCRSHVVKEFAQEQIDEATEFAMSLNVILNIFDDVIKNKDKKYIRLESENCNLYCVNDNKWKSYDNNDKDFERNDNGTVLIIDDADMKKVVIKHFMETGEMPALKENSIISDVTEKISLVACSVLEKIFPGISCDGSTQPAAMKRRQ